MVRHLEDEELRFARASGPGAETYLGFKMMVVGEWRALQRYRVETWKWAVGPSFVSLEMSPDRVSGLLAATWLLLVSGDGVGA